MNALGYLRIRNTANRVSTSRHRSRLYGSCERPSIIRNGKTKKAVVIVDHGSKRMEANLLLEQVVEAFRLQSQFDVVHLAHMEIAKPDISDAIRNESLYDPIEWFV